MNETNNSTGAAAPASSHAAFADKAETALRHVRRLAVITSWTVSNETRRADDGKGFVMPEATVEDVFALTRAIEDIISGVLEDAR